MSTVTHARALDVHAEVTKYPVADVVVELRTLLGARIVAQIASATETRAVREWADGGRSIKNPETVQRLRVALQAALLVTTHDTPAVAQAWFQGLNPRLDDRSPARVLRDGDPDTDGASVLAAAKAFAALG